MYPFLWLLFLSFPTPSFCTPTYWILSKFRPLSCQLIWSLLALVPTQSSGEPGKAAPEQRISSSGSPCVWGGQEDPLLCALRAMGLWDLLQPPDIPSTLVILRRGDIKDVLSALSPLKCHWRNGLHFVRLTCSWASLKFKNKANSGYLFLKHSQAGVPLPASPMFLSPLLFCPAGERCFLWRMLALQNPVLSRARWPPQGKR